IITMLIQSKVALERVSAFLKMSEIASDNVQSINDPVAASKYVPKNVIVAIEDGEFGWDDNDTSLLKHVNLQIRAGEFVVVHGTVGCGKSSLDASVYILDSPLAAAQDRPDYLPLVSPLPRQPYIQSSYTEDAEQQRLLVVKRADAEPDVPTYDEVAEVNDEQALVSPFREPKVKTFGGDSRDTGKLIVDEERSEGRVGNHIFAAYYHAVGGFPVVFVVLLAQMLWQTFQISSDFWLSSWSSDSIAHPDAPDSTVEGGYLDKFITNTSSSSLLASP
ncbi:hypothetical protein PybrP1_006769, partial [[Pythium] brassicae (nom. inval.)]